MPFKTDRPEARAHAQASSSSAAAKRFYAGGQAAAYTTSANDGIQTDLTEYALGLLAALAPPYDAMHASRSRSRSHHGSRAFLLLDIGAGSGLSTSAALRWLSRQGVDAFAVAFDISASMLALTANNSREGGEVTALTRGGHAEFYCGNAAQMFPLRAQCVDAAIGISMLQWLTEDGLRTCYASLFHALAPTANAVFQVYPSSPEQVVAMEQVAIDAGFAYAEVLVAFPHATTAKKWFLLLKKQERKSSKAELPSGVKASELTELCPFGRRHERRCAWHLLTEYNGKHESALLSKMQEDLGREHVKAAWHIWRKFKRASEFQTKAATPSARKLHAKAKRSLALWKSDEMIGEALREHFLPAAEEATGLTYNGLLSRTDEVIDVMHKAYTASASLERSLGREATTSDVPTS